MGKHDGDVTMFCVYLAMHLTTGTKGTRENVFKKYLI